MSNINHTTEVDRAAAMAAGLRCMAGMVTDQPHLSQDLRNAVGRVLVSVGHGNVDAREQVLRFARAGVACGATVTEHDNGTWAGVDVAFGPAVSLHVYGRADEVHGLTRRTVEQVDGVTCRITEYTPRSILAELDTTGTAAGGMGAVA